MRSGWYKRVCEQTGRTKIHIVRRTIKQPSSVYVCLFSTTDALTFAACSVCRYSSVHYEHALTFRFERECIFGIFVMIDFISIRWGLFR